MKKIIRTYKNSICHTAFNAVSTAGMPHRVRHDRNVMNRVFKGVLMIFLTLTSCKTPIIKEEIRITEHKIDPSFSIDWVVTKQDTIRNTIYILDTIFENNVREGVNINMRIRSEFDKSNNMQKIDVDSEPIIHKDTLYINNTITKEEFIPFYIWIIIGVSLLLALISTLRRRNG